MPQTSPYRIDLSDDEREYLEVRTRRYTSLYREVVRARIVLYAAAGLSNDAIASRFDTPRQVVQRARRPGHAHRTVRLSATRFLERLQRLQPPRPSFRRAARRQVAEPAADAPPVHASWLNQIEIYFSIVKRQFLEPNAFSGLHQVASRLLAFNTTTNRLPPNSTWKFTRADLRAFLQRTPNHPALAACPLTDTSPHLRASALDQA